MAFGMKLHPWSVALLFSFIVTASPGQEIEKPPRVEPISVYRENYLLGGYDSSGLNEGAVFKFQLSIKAITLLEGLYLGYTQRSFMDVLTHSFPFYDHVFAPEIFYRPTWFSPGPLEYVQGGLLHESNGLDGPNSRSWNRIYLETNVRYKNFYFRPVVWAPFLVEDPVDMKRYYGYGEATLGYRSDINIEGSLRGRIGEKYNKGSLMFDFSVPFAVFNKERTKFHYAQIWFQTWYGQGETLIGLDKNSLAISAGVGFRPKVNENSKTSPLIPPQPSPAPEPSTN